MTGPEQSLLERFLRIRVLGDVLLGTENLAVAKCVEHRFSLSHCTFGY